MGKFLRYDRPMITSMVQGTTPERVIELIKKSDALGADAFGIQTCKLEEKDRNIETYRRIFAAAEGKPTYVTNYRKGENRHTSLDDEKIGEHIIDIARAGATLVDVMGDLYDRHPDELTTDPAAIDKQKRLIERIHAEGAEVLMSSHTMKYMEADRVLEIAMAQKERGADIIKIVTYANSEEEQLENLKTSLVLERELGAPFLLLAGGECNIHRRLGPMFGASMWLCVAEHDEHATPVQPLISQVKAICENIK
ncbi:MAG: type I 3-dehydroquinate dehydratase [Clostridia bacterium]|nr:type I 3-dehydroquinate dehydratase [Clostridia bacterium]